MGGKTGTTDDFTNAWFIGFTPSLAVGVWMGRSENTETLGRGETGARAALPIWIRFFEEGLGTPSSQNPAEEFIRPPGLSRTLVDARTGLRASENGACGSAILEIFPGGKEPQRWCETRDWLRTQLPYPLQVFPIDRSGRLLAGPREIARLVVRSRGRLQVSPGGSSISYQWPGPKDSLETGSVRLAWTTSEWLSYLEAEPIARADYRVEGITGPEGASPASRAPLGADGFPAAVLEANRSGGMLELPVPHDPR